MESMSLAHMPTHPTPLQQLETLTKMWAWNAQYAVSDATGLPKPNKRRLLGVVWGGLGRKGKGVGCRARPLGRIITRRHIRLFGIIFTPVYRPDCGSDPRSWPLFFGYFCTVMLTVDWSWRGNVLDFVSLALQKREERKPECLVSAFLYRYFTNLEHLG